MLANLGQRENFPVGLVEQGCVLVWAPVQLCLH